MKISFKKYQGTGNDFIMIDCTAYSKDTFQLSTSQISHLCDRRFGIGADGVILIFNHSSLHFEMQYFNADGTRSFCGNGARCAVQFAKTLQLLDNHCSFQAIDGVHHASIDDNLISLKMLDVHEVNRQGDAYIIDTGSPHFIRFVADLAQEDIYTYGRSIRYSPSFKEQGINVNLVVILETDSLKMLTYERGVEDETFSCGTGATAVALAYVNKNEDNTDFCVKIEVKGGNLKVKGKKETEGFTSIYLIGPAVEVYGGQISF